MDFFAGWEVNSNGAKEVIQLVRSDLSDRCGSPVGERGTNSSSLPNSFTSFRESTGMDSTLSADAPTVPILDAATARRLWVAAGLTIAGDFVLWGAEPGLSLALFALASCVTILIAHSGAKWSRSMVVGCFLMGITAVQACIETSFSNLFVLLLLLAWNHGDAVFPEVRQHWVRWTEGVWSLIRVPTGWLWAGPALRQVPANLSSARAIGATFVQVGLPTALAVLVFSILLTRGNAILADWFGAALSRASDLVPELTVGRLVFWLVIATFAIGLVRPVAPMLSHRVVELAAGSRREPRDLRIARLRTLSIVTAVNILFFAVNTIDGFFLWVHQTLPTGVSYSEFVHQGVHSLILAVLLSALVLTAAYQQAASVTASRVLRILALVWIVQNVALIASVLLRLKLYVDAYQLSEQRIYVAFFLLLVTAGFCLLARRIIAGKSLQWLLLSNALAAFTLFFTVQFLDVARWVADYNVARWQENPSRVLDVEYLGQLGHSAFPALIVAAETPGRSEAHSAFLYLQARKEHERERLGAMNWRSLQFREHSNAQRLVQHEFRTRR
jgi:hypothetical protein